MAEVLRANVTVYVRAAWSASWTVAPYLRPIKAARRVAPEISTAIFEYDYGTIKREPNATFADYPPLDIVDKFVKIADPTGDILWYGYITDVHDDHAGSTTATLRGTQKFTAYGLEDLLYRTAIDGAMIAPVDPEEPDTWINYCPTFNLRHRQGGTALGNRSTAKHGDSHIFSADGARWNYKNIAEYLIANYPPTQFTWELGDQVDDFEDETMDEGGFDIVFDPTGLSIGQALDALFDRRVGYSWMLRVVPQETGPEHLQVWVFSHFASAVSAGDMTFSANTEQVAYTPNAFRDYPAVFTREERAARVDKVRVVGARVKSCFTVSFEDVTLEIGWSDDEVTAYQRACVVMDGYGALLAFEQAQYNDRFRADDRWRRVYSLFRVPALFDWMAGDGQGSTPKICSPIISTNGVPGLVNGPYWNHARPILNGLPLEEGLDYSTIDELTDTYPDNNPDDAEPAYRKPFAIVKDAAGKYCLLERCGQDGKGGAHFQPDDREMAFYARFPVNHQFAMNDWYGIVPSPQPTEHEPEIDYATLVATICVPIDDVLAAEAQIAGTVPSAGFTREMVIRIPDAELWYVAKGTVVGIGPGNTLQCISGGEGAAATAEIAEGAVTGLAITDGGSGYTVAPTVSFVGGGGGAGAAGYVSLVNGQVVYIYLTDGGSGYTTAPTVVLTTGGVVLRSDARRLRIIAKLALTWANTDRRSVLLKRRGLWLLPTLGGMITTVRIAGDAETPVVKNCNAVCTQLEWDFENLETSLEANWYGIDWGRVANCNAFGTPTARALAVSQQSAASQQSALANWGARE